MKTRLIAATMMGLIGTVGLLPLGVRMMFNASDIDPTWFGYATGGMLAFGGLMLAGYFLISIADAYANRGDTDED